MDGRLVHGHLGLEICPEFGAVLSGERHRGGDVEVVLEVLHMKQNRVPVGGDAKQLHGGLAASKGALFGVDGLETKVVPVGIVIAGQGWAIPDLVLLCIVLFEVRDVLAHALENFALESAFLLARRELSPAIALRALKSGRGRGGRFVETALLGGDRRGDNVTTGTRRLSKHPLLREGCRGHCGCRSKDTLDRWRRIADRVAGVIADAINSIDS